MPDTRETLVAMRERLVADLAALQDGFVKTQGGIATVDKMLAELDAAEAARAAGPGEPPVPGAVWSEKDNEWKLPEAGSRQARRKKAA